MILKADELEFEVLVIGDVNESGGVTVTDLAQLKITLYRRRNISRSKFKSSGY